MPSKQVPPEVLSAFISSRDVACPSCGYNLRGLSADHCPECRTPLELVLEGDPKPAGWRWRLLIGAGCAAAASSAIQAWWRADTWRRWRLRGTPWHLDVGDWILFAVHVLMVVAVVVCISADAFVRTRTWSRRLWVVLVSYVLLDSLVTAGMFIARRF